MKYDSEPGWRYPAQSVRTVSCDPSPGVWCQWCAAPYHQCRHCYKIRLQTNLSQMKAFLSKVNRQYNNYRVLYAKIISNAQFHAFIFLQFLKKKTRRKIPGKRSLKRALKWSVRCARRVSMTKTRWSNTPCSFTPSTLRVCSVWWCWCRAPTGSTVSRMPTRRQMMIMVSC